MDAAIPYTSNRSINQRLAVKPDLLWNGCWMFAQVKRNLTNGMSDWIAWLNSTLYGFQCWIYLCNSRLWIF